MLFLGADDKLVNCLHRIAPRLKSQGTIYYGDVYMSGKNKVYDGRFNATKLACKNICQQAIFYPRAVFQGRKHNLKYPVLADWALNLECWAEFHFQYIPHLVSIYNDTGNSARCSDPEFQRDKERLVKQNLSRALQIERWKNFALSCASRVLHAFRA